MCSVRSAGTPSGGTRRRAASTGRQFLGAGDPLLHLADAGEVLVELLPVGAAELAVEVLGVVEDRVQHAGPQLGAVERLGVVGLVGEQPVEDCLGFTSVGSGVVGVRQASVCS